MTSWPTSTPTARRPRRPRSSIWGPPAATSPTTRTSSSYREGLRYLRGELLAVVANLAKFADTYKATPTLGYTHYQPAQLVTVGKRATLWMQDLLADLEELDFVLST